MELVFVPEKLPRTITRQEWKECWRWKRVVTRQLREAMDKKLEYALLFGDAKLKEDVISEAVNPPILLGPYQDFNS